MSQDFKLKFEENKETINTEVENSSADSAINGEKYVQPTGVRNIAFITTDGEFNFFNYSYLIRCQYVPDKPQIILYFTTHTIELSGHKLEPLAYELLAHIPRIIRCADERYNSLTDDELPIVTSIIIKEPQQKEQ